MGGGGGRWAGSVPFEVQTAMQSTALGCGSPVVQPDNTVFGQSCWLVIIPRGTGDSGSVRDQPSRACWWDAWEHHLAVELDFKPLGVRCEIGAAERQLAGSELVAGAIVVVAAPALPGRERIAVRAQPRSEADAVVRAAGMEPSPLAFTSRPLDLSRVSDTTDPVAYAPVALSGIAISFSIDRQPHPLEAQRSTRRARGCR